GKHHDRPCHSVATWRACREILLKKKEITGIGEHTGSIQEPYRETAGSNRHFHLFIIFILLVCNIIQNMIYTSHGMVLCIG
ncbi:MAG: hypothetical protein LBQ70_04460, partial [Prevotellaceae bacterium]|nr:hypothetical protein [Prevotellaceae bacterium]